MSRVTITNLKSLPKSSGIYKVIDYNNQVLYIGQAKNIYQRWNNGHHKIGDIIAICGTDAYVEWAIIPEWLLNRAENSAIDFYQPLLNQKTSPIV